MTPQIEGVELGQLLKIVPQSKIPADSVRKVVKIKNLKDDPIAYQESFSNLMPTVTKSGAYEVIGKVLLLSLFGNKLRPTLFNKEDEKIVLSRDILACEINESLIDPDYLIHEMHAEYFQEQLSNYSAGTVMPTLRKSDVLKLKIKMPPSYFQGNFEQSLAEQKAEAKGAKEAVFMARIKEAGLEDQIRLVSSNFEEALRLKKHNLLQHHNNIKSSISALKTLLEQEGAIKSSDYISTNTSVEDHLKMVYESALTFGNLIENLADDEKFDEKATVNAGEMIDYCMKAVIRPSLFDYDYFFDESSFRLDTDQLRRKMIKPLIEIGKNDFQELFNNIVENAIRHGFVEDGKKYLLHISLAYNEETSFVEISFANNGKAFPRGLDKKFYSLKGEKAGPTGRTGYGGHRVSTMVDHYSGRLVVIDDRTSNFPVKIIVGFPIKIEADEI